jgi:hypothetical protein
VDGAARRLVTAAVRLATRPPCRARKPLVAFTRRSAGADAGPAPADPEPAGPAEAPAAAEGAEPEERAGAEPVRALLGWAGPAAPPVEVRTGWAWGATELAGPAARPAEGATGAALRPTGLAGIDTELRADAPGFPCPTGGSGSARRIARFRRRAVIGPGAENGALGTALPTPPADRAGADRAVEEDRAAATGAAPSALPGSVGVGRKAAVARAADRRSAAATPPPLCWETAPALAARADVESPLPVEFPGGAEPDPERSEPGEPVEPVLADEDPEGGAGRGARSLRCSCELVIGPAAVTSSIRRTGMAVDTRPPAMVPGERGWSSVGTCRAARANPRGGSAGTAGLAAGSSEVSVSPGVHQRGGRTSACPIERADTGAAAAKARRTATGRAVAAAKRLDEAATSPRLAARASPAGRPGRRSRCAAARPSAVGSVSSVLIGSSIESRDGRPRVAPAAPRCWPS